MENFDWRKYINHYNDLTIYEKDFAVNHWLHHGVHEGRIFFKKSDNEEYLDWMTYTFFYKDLTGFGKKEAIQHWKHHGIHENRIFFNIEDKLCYRDWDKYREEYEDLRHLPNEQCIFHWLHFGKSEGRRESFLGKYGGNEAYILPNNNASDYKDEISSFYPLYSKNNSIIVSLTSIPCRFVCHEFINVIEHLHSQIFKPKYIVIHLCKEYNRQFTYDESEVQRQIQRITERFDNVRINYSKDYGPITKILGFADMEKPMDICEEDIVIVVDDDWMYSPHLTYYHALSYQLYQAQCVYIDQKNIVDWNQYRAENIEYIIKDQYQGAVFGWLSFSIKYKCIPLLKSFYEKVLSEDVNIMKHDDLIMTLFYKVYCLYACELSIVFNIPKVTEMDHIMALREDDHKMNSYRQNLEENFYKKYNIAYDNIHGKGLVPRSEDVTQKKINLHHSISERTLLYNIQNVEINPMNNDFHNVHVDYKYFMKDILLVTLTFYKKPDRHRKEIFFFIDGVEYNISFPIPSENSTKYTYLLKINHNLQKIEHREYSFPILQVYVNRHSGGDMSLYRFYSIQSILTYIPDVKYILFDDIKVQSFIESIYKPFMMVYEKLIPGAYRSDFFRALYIYYNGGIYFDCKNILYQPMHSYLTEYAEYYVKDFDGIYNGTFYCSYPRNINLFHYIVHMLKNIIYENYTHSCLGITGPILMHHYIHENIFFKKINESGNDWKRSYVSDKENKVYIKNAYNDYYEENNYIGTQHYGILYENRMVFKKVDIPFSKINGISHIVWINLERCVDRREHMNSLLYHVNVPNTRIEAVDGKNPENVRLHLPIQRSFGHHHMSDYEIACVYSHLKSIHSLQYKEGDYFMVCEDDICFEHLYLFEKDLNTIIREAPSFDILLLHHLLENNLTDMYTNWNHFYQTTNRCIASTACYIITKEAVQRFCSLFTYEHNTFIFHNPETKMSVADEFLYQNNNTWVYKYNFIRTKYNDSMIHGDHVDFHRIFNHNKVSQLLMDSLMHA
jgi:GR25 family glycosyltransferase involved in LPS biosynthesis